MKIRLLLFFVSLNLSLSFIVNSQTELLAVYRKSDEAQNIFSSEIFPSDEIKEIYAKNQQFIDVHLEFSESSTIIFEVNFYFY
jgi:hypothetical protein